MSEFRTDPLFGHTVLLSRERANRPHRIRVRDELELTGPCPLCPGNESLSPPEIARLPEGAARWQSRAFANRYPAVELEADPQAPESWTHSQEAVLPGFGAHEIVVESPAHSIPFWAAEPDQAVEALRMVQWRTTELFKDGRIVFAQTFKNHRASAGGSLEHPNFEIVGLSFIPRPMVQLLSRADCGVCALVECELALPGGALRAERFLAQTSRFVALADFAPSYPYQFSIFPRAHAPAFEESSLEDLEDFSRIASLVIGRFERMTGEFPLNLILHSRPNPKAFSAPDSAAHWDRSSHWFARIHPRLVRHGGFEIGTGVPIVRVAPEDAARMFREKGV